MSGHLSSSLLKVPFLPSLPHSPQLPQELAQIGEGGREGEREADGSKTFATSEVP